MPKINYHSTAEAKATADGIPVFCAHDAIILIDDLKPNPKNPNQHSDSQIRLLSKIIVSAGWRAPVTVSNLSGMIVRGHGRLCAAKDAGLKEVPVDYQNYTSESEEYADLIADNRLSELSELDNKMLVDLLSEINIDNIPLELSGYTDSDFKSLLQSFAAVELPMEIADDVMPEPPERPVTRSGDIWMLGSHRLLCGDSTLKESYDALLGDEKVDLIVTDPPYNVDYEGEAGKIQNDHMSDDNFREFLDRVFKNMFEYSRGGTPIYIFHADTEGLAFRQSFIDSGFALKQCLIWVKNRFVFGRQDYQWQHEPIIYGWNPTAAHYFVDDHTQSTVIESGMPDFDLMNRDELFMWVQTYVADQLEYGTIIRENNPTKSKEHPTMKPVKLVGRLISNSSQAGDIILDGFGGAGSTLIACEYLGRAARLIELELKFCDVIVKRYIQITGRKDIRCMRAGVECTDAVSKIMG